MSKISEYSFFIVKVLPYTRILIPVYKNWTQYHTSVILALGKLRHENCHKFKDSLGCILNKRSDRGYIERPHLKNKQTKHTN